MTAESLGVGETPATPEFDLSVSIPLDEPLATPEPEFEMPKDISLPELDFVPPEEPLEFEAMSDNALEFDLTTEEPALEIPEPESVAESLPADAFDFAAEAPELSVSEPSFSGAGIGSLEPEPEFGESDFTSPAAVDPAPEELGEIDFYIAQELYEEARKRIDALAQRFPVSQEIAFRRAQVERAPAPVAPTDLSADLIESELLTALPEEDDIHIIAAPRAPQPVVPAVDESNLFAEEDDFFDLAAELEEELEQEEATVSLSDEEQSLEEIFREFKKGVEQQLDSEDYDTHYNLGIAYKEMGLIDEAIGEFQLASKDPKRTIECCSMLGLCFLEKGMPQLAIKWYGKGLEVPEISEDEHLGLLYDLALVYLEVGDVTSAQKAFVEIYGMNSNYRDVVNRIKQLEDVRN
jgi:tetratricopeptide (TPR) repeat protein